MKDLLEKELAELRKKVKKTALAQAKDVKVLSGESLRLEKQYAIEQKKLEDKVKEDKEALGQFEEKKRKGLKELEKNYLDSVAAFEESYLGWIEATRKEIEEN